MSGDTGFHFSLKEVPYDASYLVGGATRATTNFANFVRDPGDAPRRIETFLALVNADLNHLLGAEGSGRHEIRLSILSLFLHVDGDSGGEGVLVTEAMRARVFDRQSGETLPGPTGLNFSSYLRDYDFRIVLPQLLQSKAPPQAWDRFGRLHGWLTRRQFGPAGLIAEPLAIAISIANNHSYRATASLHPILGREYRADSTSLTDRYFAQMGLRPRYFRPDILPAPLAIYSAQPLQQQSDAYLAALIAVMANFQRIYRPEIYSSCSGFSAIPGAASRASLANVNYANPALPYDREEREQLADQQARFIEAALLKPYGQALIRQMDAEEAPRSGQPRRLDESPPGSQNSTT